MLKSISKVHSFDKSHNYVAGLLFMTQSIKMLLKENKEDEAKKEKRSKYDEPDHNVTPRRQIVIWSVIK